ncbi:MAG: hypothetical protein ABIN89_15300 [Chitinophagaceae bacterium]
MENGSVVTELPNCTGISRQLIPDIAFINPPTVVSYKYYKGNWNALPDFSKLNPVKTGMEVNIDLGMRKRDTLYGISRKSSINITKEGVILLKPI